MRAGDVLRRDTLEKAPLEAWVKMCGSCTDMIEAAYGKEGGEAEADAEAEAEAEAEEDEDEEWEWIPAPLPDQPNLPEDWDLFLSVQDHLPFAEEDQE